MKLKSKSVRRQNRRGAALPFAVVLFVICALSSMAILTAARVDRERITHRDRRQRDYEAASSAACLVRDSMTEPGMGNVVKLVCLQYLNGEGAELKIRFLGDDMAEAECSVEFDEALTFTFTVTAGTYTLRVTVPVKANVTDLDADTHEWDREASLIELIE